ncbi:hypothetical protein AYO21_00561 [Fonsecaea monophora]|uniref:Uncharacterized protein n=1 Tax=Fonsecaea monophora TaxID=254056 RepID=A0A177FLL2_9EURO|nr:hypothetical protein AYO21_00561 [Fonsecaea monophora]OAG45213.1 hypothetical protein AYO21_00561 [Fonsecaea monophora]
MAVYDPNTAKVAIITGAAKTSIGALAVRNLVKRGWHVAILDILEEQGEKLSADTIFIKCDVSSYQQQAEAFQKVKQLWGRLDAFIPNAGIVERSSYYIFRHRDSTEVPPEPNTLGVDVTFKAVMYGVQLAIHFMRQNATPGGQIVTVASVAGLYGSRIYPEYSGSKAAVIGFSLAIAPILQKKENIQLNTVAPGIVRAEVVPQALIDANGYEKYAYHHLDSLVIDAILYFLDNKDIAGQLVEVSGEKRLVVQPRPYANGTPSQRAAAMWAPVFQHVHGEPSEVPGEITW